jgi:hypothetical protein
VTRAARWSFFLRALAGVFAVAFASLAVQITGLVGEGGISPAAELLRVVREQFGVERFVLIPTLFWVDASEGTLVGAAWAGVLVAGLAVMGWANRWCFLALTALYLSLAGVCGEFLGFQWDNLLIEAGLLAAFAAPASIRVRAADRSIDPPPLFDRLLEFLLVRLVFFSGFVKLASGDPTWRDFTALQFHFETQPLPTWTSWWCHQAPPNALRVVCALSILAELVFPILLALGTRARIAGAAGIVLLQLGFAATGNFGFFNLLTVVLCIPLFGGRAGRDSTSRPERVLAIAYAGLVLWIGGLSSLERIVGRPFLPGLVRSTLEIAAPFRVVNDYGLFAVMTTTRPEIVVEASDDGVAWREVAFRWKPQDPARRPAFTGPHMPRLDWQMWFAALEAEGRGAPPAWVRRFLARILEGSPSVAALLAPRPPGAPAPRYVRARLDSYRFASIPERRAGAIWWTRRPLGALTPVLSLEPGE